ncbi:MAG: hypothetical protein KY460_11730 [Actinobacteria bacterium]|nr:hypothetical protein [Actinomycetota bacterium]
MQPTCRPSPRSTGGVVAVGTFRTADDPADGGFRPAAWHSENGERWSAVPLPGPTTEGSVHAVAATDREVLAVGRVGRTGIMWSSVDGGTSWSVVERDGIPPMASLDDIAVEATCWW